VALQIFFGGYCQDFWNELLLETGCEITFTTFLSKDKIVRGLFGKGREMPRRYSALAAEVDEYDTSKRGAPSCLAWINCIELQEFSNKAARRGAVVKFCIRIFAACVIPRA
jgi:hypothetical protein